MFKSILLLATVVLGRDTVLIPPLTTFLSGEADLTLPKAKLSYPSTETSPESSFQLSFTPPTVKVELKLEPLEPFLVAQINADNEDEYLYYPTESTAGISSLTITKAFSPPWSLDSSVGVTSVNVDLTFERTSHGFILSGHTDDEATLIFIASPGGVSPLQNPWIIAPGERVIILTAICSDNTDLTCDSFDIALTESGNVSETTGEDPSQDEEPGHQSVTQSSLSDRPLGRPEVLAVFEFRVGSSISTAFNVSSLFHTASHALVERFINPDAALASFVLYDDNLVEFTTDGELRPSPMETSCFNAFSNAHTLLASLQELITAAKEVQSGDFREENSAILVVLRERAGESGPYPYRHRFAHLEALSAVFLDSVSKLESSLVEVPLNGTDISLLRLLGAASRYEPDAWSSLAESVLSAKIQQIRRGHLWMMENADAFASLYESAIELFNSQHELYDVLLQRQARRYQDAENSILQNGEVYWRSRLRTPDVFSAWISGRIQLNQGSIAMTGIGADEIQITLEGDTEYFLFAHSFDRPQIHDEAPLTEDAAEDARCTIVFPSATREPFAALDVSIIESEDEDSEDKHELDESVSWSVDGSEEEDEVHDYEAPVSRSLPRFIRGSSPTFSGAEERVSAQRSSPTDVAFDRHITRISADDPVAYLQGWGEVSFRSPVDLSLVGGVTVRRVAELPQFRLSLVDRLEDDLPILGYSISPLPPFDVVRITDGELGTCGAGFVFFISKVGDRVKIENHGRSLHVQTLVANDRWTIVKQNEEFELVIGDLVGFFDGDHHLYYVLDWVRHD